MRRPSAAGLVVWMLAVVLGGQAQAETLYVVRRGWHTDVGFPVEELEDPLQPVARAFPGVRTLFFSFGDRRYLLAGHTLGPSMMLALWPGRGLLLATALRASPVAAFGAGHVLRIEVTPAQSREAQVFIRNSADAGSLRAGDYRPGPYEGGVYIDSILTYSAGRTCNTWVGEVLAAAALPIHLRGLEFASQLWRRARKLPGAAIDAG